MIRALLIICFFIIFVNANDQTYRVVFPKNFPPSYITVDNKPSGYAIELFEEVAKDLNIKFIYLAKGSWQDVIHLVNDDKVDIIPNMGISPQRAKKLLFSSVVQSINISVYSKKGKKVLSQEFLKGKKVGVLSTNIARKILAKNKDISLKVYTNKEYAFLDFIEGQVDYFAYPEPSITQLAKKYKVEHIIEKNFDLKIINRAVAVSNQYPELIEKIDASLEKLKKSGKMDALFNKWHEKEKKFTLEEILMYFAILVVLIIGFLIWLAYKRIIVTKTFLEEELDRKTKYITEQNNKFAFAANKALNGSWEWNLETNKMFLSSSWYTTFGYGVDEFSPDLEELKALVYDKDKVHVLQSFDNTITGKNDVFDAEFRAIKKDTTLLWIRSLGTIYINDEKERIFFGFNIDISSMKALEQQRIEKDNILFQQSKMAAMGEMLQNIAHQWRQPLSTISTVASGIQVQKEMDLLDDKLLNEELQLITRTSEYLSETIDTFRDFFKAEKSTKEFDVSQVIEHALEIVGPKFKVEDIAVITKLEPLTIMSVENDLIQVLLNILNNSKDVLEEKPPEEKRLILISLEENGKEISIHIKDNGGGANEEIISKLFEPYFTTKHQSQGTGLGLYMSEEIITKHLEGNLLIHNVNFIYEEQPYKGLETVITLPL